MLRGALVVKALLALALVAGAFGLYLRLESGPLRIDGLSQRVEAALARQLGDAWRVSLHDTSLGLADGALALRVAGLDVHNADGVLVARAPQAVVAVDPWSLLTGEARPRSIAFEDVHLRARVARDGSLSLVPLSAAESVQAQTADGEPPPEPSAALLAAHASPAAFLASLFDLMLDRSSPVGALDRASLVNARLTLIDERGRERVGFSAVDAHFDRADTVRRFSAALDGPGGPWRIDGQVEPALDGAREASLSVAAMPVRDLMLVSGLSALAGSDDLKLSGGVVVALDAQSGVRRFEASLWSGAGRLVLADPDLPFVSVDRLAAETRWDPVSETLVFETLDYRAGATNVRLTGEMIQEAGGDWRLSLAGRDATLAGAADEDQPVLISDIALSARGGAGGIVVESLSLDGPVLSAGATFSFGGAEDRGGLRVGVRAVSTDVRTALRIWPEFVAPKPRAFLVKSLRAGEVRDLSVSVVLTGEDLAAMHARRGLPREAIDVDFTVADATLLVNPDLPPLSEALVTGTVGGRSAEVRASSGTVPMADGRSLAFSEGSFVLPDFWSHDALADIAFRVAGGADALVSFLHMPALNQAAGIDLDPALVSGEANLSVSIPLAVKDVPKVSDIPISISGTLSSLKIDKIMGGESLEGAKLALNYEHGGLELDGGGKIGGADATIRVRQPAGAPGEAIVGLILDDAERARRGFDLGAQLKGPIALTINAPLARDSQTPVRIHADLAAASIVDLLPGWSKPAGRQGQLSFALHRGDKYELRDIALDSGAAQIRGFALVSAAGVFEKAEFGTFKLAPGDDVRVQVEKSGGALKINTRGNVVDARAFIDIIGASGPRTGARALAGDDVDVDLSVNILTGFNDEAMTKAALKLVLRGGELRELSLDGRFPAAPVRARITELGGKRPVLVLQSEDAGALLRFGDVYGRMIGGDLVFRLALGGERRPGDVMIRDFVLRDEPALRRIVSHQPVGVPVGGDVHGVSPPPQINASAARFIKAKANFALGTGRVDFTEAVMWGSQVGFKLDGWVDYGADKVDIQGTFVPAYGLNNVFAQVPLFGPILGGSQYEGLFAVNFRVSGAASAPSLTINPLSAIAPGFLRRLFGAAATETATGATRPPPLPER